MSEELDGEKLVENIEKFGSVDGDPEATKEVVEETPPENTEEPKTEPLVFKSPDDILRHKLPYKAADKEVEEDIETILKRASQGYHYAQQMEALKKQQAEFEEQRKRIEEMEAKWSPYEEQAKKDPDWYNHWNTAYQNRFTRNADGEFDSDAADFQARLDAALQEKLKPYEERFRALDEKESTTKIHEEDQRLSDEVESIRGEYKDIDFDHTDPETGMSLEAQILQFGAKEGINSFKTAFEVMMRDTLVERQLRLKEEERQKLEKEKRKNGIISESTESHSRSRPVDTRHMSLDEAMKMAERDLAEGKI